MTEPRYQFWRTIQPVEGQPIPDGAELKLNGTWYPETDRVFSGFDERYAYRVPVEVVPIDVVVDAIMHNAINGDNYWTVEIDGQRGYRADTKEKLRELVVAKLRELSREKVNATD